MSNSKGKNWDKGMGFSYDFYLPRRHTIFFMYLTNEPTILIRKPFQQLATPSTDIEYYKS